MTTFWEQNRSPLTEYSDWTSPTPTFTTCAKHRHLVGQPRRWAWPASLTGPGRPLLQLLHGVQWHGGEGGEKHARPAPFNLTLISFYAHCLVTNTDHPAIEGPVHSPTPRGKNQKGCPLMEIFLRMNSDLLTLWLYSQCWPQLPMFRCQFWTYLFPIPSTCLPRNGALGGPLLCMNSHDSNMLIQMMWLLYNEKEIWNSSKKLFNLLLQITHNQQWTAFITKHVLLEKTKQNVFQSYLLGEVVVLEEIQWIQSWGEGLGLHIDMPQVQWDMTLSWRYSRFLLIYLPCPVSSGLMMLWAFCL